VISAGDCGQAHDRGHNLVDEPVEMILRLRRARSRGGDMTATFTRSDELHGARFDHTDLHGARFVASNLSGVVMRGVEVDGADIDAPWLLEGGDRRLLVNGVDVTGFVDAELNRRFPGRAERRAADPDGLRHAWAALERTWAATLERVSAMPEGTVDISVDGEWSFAQTLRHLVHATDMWLGRGILELDRPFHPLGQIGAETEDDQVAGTQVAEPPAYPDVLRTRENRVAMMRDLLATVTAEQLAEARKNPHAPEYPETVLSCLHTIIEEEWEHHRYAVRDLDTIEAGSV
jgi:hypothetical protein